MAPAVGTHGRSLMHLLCTDKGTLAMNMSRLGMCDPRCSKQAMITFSFQECAVKIARLAVRCNDMGLHAVFYTPLTLPYKKIELIYKL